MDLGRFSGAAGAPGHPIQTAATRARAETVG